MCTSPPCRVLHCWILPQFTKISKVLPAWQHLAGHGVWRGQSSSSVTGTASVPWSVSSGASLRPMHVITVCTDCPCSWLREQHAIPGAVNALFAPRLGTRIKISLDNPLFVETGEISTPNQYFQKNRLNPLLSSTQHSQHGFEDDSFEYEAVDVVIKNPLYGSGLNLQKVCWNISLLELLVYWSGNCYQANCVVVNKYFGCGLPDYDAIDQRKGKWIVQVKGDG